MNWSQAMKAMLEGKKVRGEYFDADTWISAENSTSYVFFSYSEFQSMDWEIYEEQTVSRELIVKLLSACADRSGQDMSNIFKEALEKLHSDKELRAVRQERYKEAEISRESVVKFLNDYSSRAGQSMCNIFNEVLADIEKLKIR